MNKTNCINYQTSLVKITSLVLLLIAIPFATNAQSWTNLYSGSGNSVAWAVAVDVNNGNVFVTGTSGSDYATIAYSSAGVSLWTNRYNGPGNSFDGAYAIAVDTNNGNVYVTGASPGSESGNDYATIAYNSAGVGLWTNRYNGPGNSYDYASAIAVDGSGNVYVTGDSSSSGGSDDYATIAYSSAGVGLWTNRYNGPGNLWDYASSVAVDVNSNVYVTGSSTGSGSSYDYTTIAYNSAGVGLWTNRYNGPGNSYDYASAVAVDGSGNVYVTGSSDGSGYENYDYATIAYNSAGVALWTNRYNGPGNDYDEGHAIAVDDSGNVYVTGPTYNGLNTDYGTIAYNSAGVALWTNIYNGLANDEDWPIAVAVDGSGNVYVTGSSDNSGYGTNDDYGTIAFNSAGSPLWTNIYNGPGNSYDYANAIAVDGSGNVYVTGSSSIGGYGDYATIKYAAVSSGPVDFTAAPAGIYCGLFYESEVTHKTSGYLQFTLKSNWKVAGGKVLIEGGSYGFSGLFSSNTHTATISVPRTDKTTLTLNLSLSQPAQDDFRVTGTVSDGSWTAALSGDKAYYIGQNPPQLGYYTMTLLPQSGQDFDGENSPGYGTTGLVKVKTNGQVTASIKLPDKNSASEATYLSKNGTWPLYTKHFKGIGSLLGWVTFTNTPDYTFTGDVSWIKTGSNGVYYTSGYTNSVTAYGSKLH